MMLSAEDLRLPDKEMERLLGEDFATAYSGHVAEYRMVRDAQAIHLLRVLSAEMDAEVEKSKSNEFPQTAFFLGERNAERYWAQQYRALAEQLEKEEHDG